MNFDILIIFSLLLRMKKFIERFGLDLQVEMKTTTKTVTSSRRGNKRNSKKTTSIYNGETE